MSGRALLLFHTRTPGIAAYTVTIIHHGPATHRRVFMTEQGFSRKQGSPQYGVVYSTLKDERFMLVSWWVPHFICMMTVTHCWQRSITVCLFTLTAGILKQTYWSYKQLGWTQSYATFFFCLLRLLICPCPGCFDVFVVMNVMWTCCDPQCVFLGAVSICSLSEQQCNWFLLTNDWF